MLQTLQDEFLQHLLSKKKRKKKRNGEREINVIGQRLSTYLDILTILHMTSENLPLHAAMWQGLNCISRKFSFTLTSAHSQETSTALSRELSCLVVEHPPANPGWEARVFSNSAFISRNSLYSVFYAEASKRPRTSLNE